MIFEILSLMKIFFEIKYGKNTLFTSPFNSLPYTKNGGPLVYFNQKKNNFDFAEFLQIILGIKSI